MADDAQTAAQALRSAAVTAGRAPSIGNTQPWQWRLHGDTLDLSVDRHRAVTAGGTALIGLSDNRDANGYLTSPAMQVSSQTVAITVEDVSLHLGDLWSRSLSNIGGVRVTATNATGTPLFLGVAPQIAVTNWLAGTAHDRLVTLTENTSGRYEHAAGPTRGVPAPAEQGFWLATGTGVLNWQATDGDFAVVLANADGTPAVAGTITVATQAGAP